LRIVTPFVALIIFHRAAEMVHYRPSGHIFATFVRAALDDPRGRVGSGPYEDRISAVGPDPRVGWAAPAPSPRRCAL